VKGRPLERPAGLDLGLVGVPDQWQEGGVQVVAAGLTEVSGD
jgi:hypothetical protein